MHTGKLVKESEHKGTCDSDVADGVHIGDSPMPGLTLRCILRGHLSCIGRIAWSPDGRQLASPSHDMTIRIWDVELGKCLTVLEGHKDKVNSVAWSPDGLKLASGSGEEIYYDNTIRIWNTKTWEPISVLKGHKMGVLSVAWSPDGRKLASVSIDGTIRIWNAETFETVIVLEGHRSQINSVIWSADGYRLASASGNCFSSNDCTVRVWNSGTWAEECSLKGHSNGIYSIAWAPNQPLLSSGACDKTIRLWNVQSGKQMEVLEGHTGSISCLTFSPKGDLLASKSVDKTIRLWRTDTWDTVAVLKETPTHGLLASLAFHPYLPRLATLGEKDSIIRIWDLDKDKLLTGQVASNSIRYTTAKLVLVGDSQVGKTVLGWRLVHNEFKTHPSTHGQQFWVVNDLCTKRQDGTVCEAVLWDLAGQHIYRSIHSIFLDNVNLALILFDQTNRQDTLKGVEFWLGQLRGKINLPPSVLIGTKMDRGESVLTRQELAQFCQRYCVSGGYISTSAMTGEGIDDLLRILKEQIHWEQMTSTVTTVTFKWIKDYVLKLKEQTNHRGVLVRPTELYRQLESADPQQRFSDAEMMAAVKHLETHGYITILRSSLEGEFILLAPELLVDLASSIVLQADKHPRELGSLDETTLLQGGYAFQELANLANAEQRILLDAAIMRFLEHNVCFREALGADTLLIFPGLIKQKRPMLDDVEIIEDTSYIVRGRIENVYAALVVLLGYTPTFTRINQWQRQAQYEMGKGQICGFRSIEDREGEMELVLYYSIAMPDFGRKIFQGLFEKFLYQRDIEITRFPPVRCSKGHLQERNMVVKFLQQGKKHLFCGDCGEKIALPEIEKPKAIGAKGASIIQCEEALARLRSRYETYLANIKGFRRDRATPRCYISYLAEEAEWVKKLVHDLREAGAYVLEDETKIQVNDFIILIGTPAYKDAWNRLAEPIASDANLIRSRIQQAASQRFMIAPILLKGDTDTALPQELHNYYTADFCNSTHYTIRLFDLVLTLYAIPFDHPAFEPLRESLDQQWKDTIAALFDEEEMGEKLYKFEQTVGKISDTHYEEAALSNQVINFLIVTALEEERDAVLNKLPGYRKLPPSLEDIRTYYYAELPMMFPNGKTGVYQVIVMPLLGMGRVQAVIATKDAIARWHPQYIILIGIAGGVAAKGISVGDILISDQIVDYELQKITSKDHQIRWEVHRADPRLLNACQNFKDESWQELLQIKRPGQGEPKRHIGPIASGDKVIAFGDLLEKYCETWPRLIGIEMEAAGVATAAFQSLEKPGFFMVRCVSDLADEHKGSAGIEKWRPYACDAAAALAIALLKSGPVPQSVE